MKYKKLNRLQKRMDRKLRNEAAFKGEGVFIYQNRTGASLILPKPSLDGKKMIEKGEQFRGDSYFKILVPSMLRCITEVSNNKEPMQEQKLILDQPDCVTEKGVVERVATDTKEKTQINEDNPAKKQPETLINEDPMAGVEIILG